MTSINYNASATSALRTLQDTNSQLDKTQNSISTGLKIGSAKDNAAYWSISTTLKSDNKALGTVSDALSLGSATVDTAYQGLNSALDVVNDLKSKITAASQDGVDKASVQSEITELQKQLKAIAGSSSFSGENWLSVNSSVTDYNADKTVVSSFSRDGNNNVTLDTIKIDTRSLVLIDGSSSNEGILDAGKSGNATATGGIAAATATQTPAVAGSAATSGGFDTAVIDLSGLAAGDHITFNVVVDGGASAAIDYTLVAGDLTTPATFATNLSTAITGATVTANPDGSFKFASDTTGTTSNVSVDTFAYTDGTNPKTPTPATGFADVTGTAGSALVAATPAANATFTMAADFAPLTLDSNDTIKFDVTVNGTAHTVRVDKATISQALGTTDGAVTSAADYATVLNQALSNANVSGVTVSAPSTKMVFTGGNDTTSLAVGDAVASNGQSVLDIDVTNATKAQLEAYLETISSVADKITSGAATLGAISARVELQKTFVDNLMDTIDKGVSGLIDADMNEESTKLQALQVKQQLGVQALSIANQSAQNVLRLFQ